jgi:hypothetical protein
VCVCACVCVCLCVCVCVCVCVCSFLTCLCFLALGCSFVEWTFWLVSHTCTRCTAAGKAGEQQRLERHSAKIESQFIVRFVCQKNMQGDGGTVFVAERLFAAAVLAAAASFERGREKRWRAAEVSPKKVSVAWVLFHGRLRTATCCILLLPCSAQ